MIGKITMEFDGPKTKIALKLKNVDLADKCAAVDNLIESLDTTREERLLILTLVAEAADVTKKEENSSES